MKILIVEDNEDLRSAIVKGLMSRGYTLDQAQDGKEGLFKARVNKYDLLILDLNLPFKDGLEIGKTLREEDNNVPILALTARDKLVDKLDGFDSGFDDYLTKPFDFDELAARIDAIIRRSKPIKDIVLEVGDILLDPRKRVVKVKGKLVDFTKYEFNILEYLMRHKGLVVKYSDMIEHVWGEDSDLLDPPIRAHIKNIRKKINDNNYTIIQTEPGVGYKIG